MNTFLNKIYNYMLVSVTLGVLFFLIVYNTDVIQVVTLGGLVLGSAIIGVGISLFAVLLRFLLRNAWIRTCVFFTICSILIVDVCNKLPGYKIRPTPFTFVFLVSFFIFVVRLVYFVMNK